MPSTSLLRPVRWRSLVLLAGLVLYAAAVYLLLVVAVGGGAAEQSPRTELGLTFAAAALVAITGEPLVGWLDRRLPASARIRLERVIDGRTAAPDLGRGLQELTRLVADALGPGAVVRTTAALGDGVSAAWQSPPGVPSPTPRRSIGVPLIRQQQVLGDLVVELPAGRAPTPIEAQLLADAQGRAAALIGVARLDLTLQGVIADADRRGGDLRRARGRILAAMEAERRRIERDIHDGAQQHLVALAVNLRLLRVLVERGSDRSAAIAAKLATATEAAREVLDRLSLGLYPTKLTAEGPAAALRELAGLAPVPIQIEDADARRWATAAEQTAYFVCLEALQNAVKHAAATKIVIEIGGSEATLAFRVSDDGVGYDPAGAGGTGTTNLRDRLAAVGGRLDVESSPGAGTTVSGSIPT